MADSEIGPVVKCGRIGHIVYETPDLEPVIQHYQSVVGLAVVSSNANEAFLVTRLGQLAVHVKKAQCARASGLSFEIPDEDLTEIRSKLIAQGIAADFVSDPAPGISRTVAFRDPEGHRVELFSGWTALQRAPSAGVAPVKFGHAAFIVGDPKQMSDFYSGVLGFRVSDWVQDYFVFMRCGPDHHTLNFLQGKEASRIHHLAFEMRDTAHLVESCDVLGENKIRIMWGPVRHGPGHNVATYHAAPDGHIVEFFCELDRMADESLGYFEPRPWHEDMPQRPKVWVGNQRRDVWGPAIPADFLSPTASLVR